MIRQSVLAVAVLALVPSVAHAQGVREVSYGPKSVVTIAAKVRFTTLIILPDGEEILDFVCGDKDLWVISGAQNFAYVKPAKPAASTNLNLVTASGHVFSFLLNEGSADPDLKVYVRLDVASAEVPAAPKFHSPAEIAILRSQLEEARRQADGAREAAARAVEDAATAKLDADRTVDERIASFRTAYPARLRFPYAFHGNPRSFVVSAMFHDGTFTYIRTEATELPALYEVIDGKPNLLTFQVEDGLYIIPKVLERGYLMSGKQTLHFDARR
jgi:type IV secretory pathway VirB9-like protein